MKDLTMTGRVPADVLEAAAKVEQWAYLEGGDGWRVMGLADRRLTDRLEAKVEMLTAKLARNHPSRHEGETHAQSILANRRWREAVYDACTVAHIGWDAGDPRKTIDQLIDWHVQVALDPKVSEPMANLTAQVRHWKANHNHLAARTALLLQRPDLPVDRIPAYRELEALQTKYEMMKTAYETELTQLKADMQEDDALRERMGALLSEVAIALNGGPLEDGLHSWHDLPELAKELMEKLAKVRTIAQMMEFRDALASGALRLNVIEDATVPADTIIIEGEGKTITLDGITKEFIEGVGKCGCWTCIGERGSDEGQYMVLCAKCGNKRCPHAKDHRNECTNSNEPGQPGSAYE